MQTTRRRKYRNYLSKPVLVYQKSSSEPPPSDLSLGTGKKNKTSTGGGDCFAGLPYGLREMPRSQNLKPRSTKYNMRFLETSLKPARVNTRQNKSGRPTYKSLRNAIVLAPFHTLKKCFQSKLFGMYAHDTLKKSQKVKLPRKKKMSFEYDVLEIKPMNKRSVKKETKIGRRAKKSGVETARKLTRKRNNSSRNYCQCDKPECLGDNKSPTKALRSQTRGSKFKLGNHTGKMPINDFPIPSSYSCNIERKRRKIDKAISYHAELWKDSERFAEAMEASQNCHNDPSTTNTSITVISSNSKLESWETFSDSSRDDQTDYFRIISKSNDNSGETLNNSSLPETNVLKRKAPRQRSKRKNRMSELPQMQKSAESRQLNSAVKSTDGQSANVPETELQRQNQILLPNDRFHPKSRPNKGKSKKSRVKTNNARHYFLRSNHSSKEKMAPLLEEKTRDLEQSANEVGQDVQKTTSSSQKEVPTPQEEGNSFFKVPVSTSSKTHLPTSSNDEGNVASSNHTPENILEPREETTPLDPQIPDACKIIHKRKSDLERADLGKVKSFKALADLDQTMESSHDWSSEVIEICDVVDNLTQQNLDFLPDLGESFRLESTADQDCAQIPVEQDKDSNFIFGPRSTPSRLGESCEFSFGLNWSLSDDDD